MSLTLFSNFISSPTQTSFLRYAAKGSDTTIISDDVLTADTDLSIDIEIGTYVVDCFLVYTSGAVPDIKFKLGDTGAFDYGYWGFSYDTTPTVKTLADTANIPCDGTDQWIWLHGVVKSNAATTVALWWAQNLSNASNTTLKAGSYMSLTKVA